MEKLKLYIAISEARDRPFCPIETLIEIVDSIIDGFNADGVYLPDEILKEYKRLIDDEDKHPFDCKCVLHA